VGDNFLISLFKFPQFIKILLTKKIATLIFLHEKYKLKQITRQESEGWSCGAVEQEFVHCNTGGTRRRPGGQEGDGAWGRGGVTLGWRPGLLQSTPVLSLR